MKFLLLIVIVFAVIWYLRNSGRTQAPRSSARAAEPPPPQDMIECPVCLVHLPRTDALAGPDGRHYCCAEHLRAAK
jgi:uncharacterized protein